MTDPTRSPRQDDLQHFWDMLVRGEPASPGTLDPELVALILQLHRQRTEVPHPDARYANRLREDLLHRLTIADTAPLASDVISPPSANGRSQPNARRDRTAPLWPRSVPHPRFTPLFVATVALIVLGLIVVALQLGDADNGGPATTPVPAPTIVVPPAISEQTLFSVVLPPEELPMSENVSAGWAHFSIPPGVNSTWYPYCCPGPMIEYIVAGVYTVQADAEIRVVRADGSIEYVPPQTETTLNAGDALVSRNETRVDASNFGSTQVELLSFVWIDDEGFNGHSLPGWSSGEADVHAPLTVAQGPATVRLRRVDLQPRAVLLPLPDAYQFAVSLPVNTAGTPVPFPASSRQPDGSIVNISSVPISVYVLTTESIGDPTRSPVAERAPP